MIPDWVINEINKIPNVKFIPNHSQPFSGFFESGKVPEFLPGTPDWNVTKVGEQLEKLNNSIDRISNVCKNIYTFFTRPDIIAWGIWCGLVKYSYIICIIITFFGIVLGLIGWRKGYKVCQITFFSYIAIQIFHILIGG